MESPCPEEVHLRGLILYRVALGVLTLGDTLYRWPDRCDMYSESGLFAAESLTSLGLSWPNLHSLDPTCEYVTVLFSIQAAAAVAVALGWRVKESLLLLWILYLSQNRRNPFVVSGGDKLLEILLLWAALMHYSMDGAGAGRRRNYALSVAVAGHKAQIVTMYFAAGLYKYHAVSEDGVAIWRSGDALERVLMCCTYRKYWGGVILQFPLLCRVLTWLTLVVELTAPVTLLCLRGWKRAICVLSFMAMHVSMGVTMTLWNFSAICITALMPFIPPNLLPWPWSRWSTGRTGRWRPVVVVGRFGRFWRGLRVGFWMSLSAILLVVTLLVTFDTLPGCHDRWGCVTSTDVMRRSRWYRVVAINLSIVQVWSMFDVPLMTCGSWRIPFATDQEEGGGDVRDAYLLKHVGASESRSCTATQPSTMPWFTLYEGLQEAHAKRRDGVTDYISRKLARYYCDRYNLSAFQLDYIVEDPSGRDGAGHPTFETTILRAHCMNA